MSNLAIPILRQSAIEAADAWYDARHYDAVLSYRRAQDELCEAIRNLKDATEPKEPEDVA